jgi:hypothetical protein
MRHEKLAIHEIDVRLDAAETVVERVEQRAFVLVVVMGVSVNERSRVSGYSWSAAKSEAQTVEERGAKAPSTNPDGLGLRRLSIQAPPYVKSTTAGRPGKHQAPSIKEPGPRSGSDSMRGRAPAAVK